MADYLSLEQAAKKLGIPTDRLVELRSQGQVRGFRDGSSWKFPEDAIDQLAEQLADSPAGGSGVLVNEPEIGSSLSSSSGLVIGGEALSLDGEGSGSEIDLDAEAQSGSGSDVNLIASESDDSDVAVVASDSDLLSDSGVSEGGGGSDLLEIDSGELQLQQPAITHDSQQLDLSVEPNSGSTGPVTDQELKAISESHPDVLAPESQAGDSAVESDLQLQKAIGDRELDSADDDALDLISSDIELKTNDSAAGGNMLDSGGASSLEMMSDLDGSSGEMVVSDSHGADVLSELDLLSSESQGSGLIRGESGDLLASSGLGSSIGADNIKDSELADLDDALDDDDLVIADDDDDLVISNVGSDISIAGDSGINLMSPSDSGLSLESEPLDLAGSSISALDLGAELSEGGSSASGSSGSDGSMVDFQADEEFQLSPSGVGLEADIESGSQVIEVEDSEAMAEPVELDDDAFAEGDVFAAEDEGEAIEIDETAAPVGMARSAATAYEIPFSMYQCLALGGILLVMGLCGMLMTDLIRNMWAYTETSTPISSLTDSLVSLVGWE